MGRRTKLFSFAAMHTCFTRSVYSASEAQEMEYSDIFLYFSDFFLAFQTALCYHPYTKELTEFFGMS